MLTVGWLWSGRNARASSPVLYKNGVAVTELTCGDTYVYDVPGYSGTTIWLTQTKNGSSQYDGAYYVPAAPYTSSCNQDEGTYYSVVKTMAGSLIGQATFTIKAKSLPSPTCSLNVNNASGAIYTGERITWTLNIDQPNFKSYWYGTKNGVADVGGAATSFPSFTGSYGWLTDPYPEDSVGSYTRYIRFINDTTNTVCDSNTVNISVISRPTPTPTPTPVVAIPNTSKSFSFTGLASGAKKSGDRYFYEDFAIVINYFGDQEAKINVRLSSGRLNYSYAQDNLGAPLVISGAGSKKTVLLNVAGVAFPVNDQYYEHYDNITVDISADQPVYALPPAEFYTSGYGSTVAEATENAWQAFGFKPGGLATAKTEYFPYAIFWRNLRAFPDGWDSRITLSNSKSRPASVGVRYFPDYNKIYNSATCQDTDLRGEVSREWVIQAGETQSFLLSQHLGSSWEASHQTEGALAFDFSQGNVDDLQIAVEVVPLSGGTRICSGETTPTPTPTGAPPAGPSSSMPEREAPRLSPAGEIRDGELIREEGATAVWIVKIEGENKYRRWLFGPQVFTAYGHLSFDRVKNVSADTLAGFTTSNLIKKVDDQKIYELSGFVPGVIAVRRWIVSEEIFRQRGHDFSAVYIINEKEFNLYIEGSPLTEAVSSPTTAGKYFWLTANLSEAMKRFLGRVPKISN